MLTNVCGIVRDLDAENAAYNKRWAEITKAGKGVRPHLIAQCCARHELESDEFYTAEQKAQLFYPNECKP